MRLILAFLATLAGPAAAEEHDHVSEAGGLRAVHAWTRATSGPEAYVFLDIENASGRGVVLTGGDTEAAGTVELVGFSYRDGVEIWTPLDSLPLDSGQQLTLAPQTLALRLSGLVAPLEEGADLDLEVNFDTGPLEVEVEIGPRDAMAHSHAGHSH